MLCAEQTTDPSSVVSGRSLLYEATATFVEDDPEVVDLQSFGGSSMPVGPLVVLI